MSTRARRPRGIAIDDALLRRWPLPSPGADGDKEARGRALVIGGSQQVPGAIVLAAIAALRAGAGRLTIATASRIAPWVAQAMWESRVIGMAETLAGSCAQWRALASGSFQCGADRTGMGGTAQNLAFVAAVLERSRGVKVILDAGATDAVQALPRDVRERRSSTPEDAESESPSLLLTPHAGELAHLAGTDKDWILEHPEEAALDAARRWNTVIALKSATTMIDAPDGRLWRHEGGNVGLATSGSGDALAGLIAGLAARRDARAGKCLGSAVARARRRRSGRACRDVRLSGARNRRRGAGDHADSFAQSSAVVSRSDDRTTAAADRAGQHRTFVR